MTGTGLAGQLARDGIGGLAVRGTSVLLGITLVFVLARSLGPEGYGVYSYVFALLSLLAVPAQMGIPSLVVRETARAQAASDWAAMRGIWRWSGRLVGGIALLLLIVGGSIAWVFANRFTENELATFAWGMLLVPIIALGNLRGAALRGLRKLMQGQLPEYVLRPGIFILLLGCAFLYLAPDGQLSAADAMGLHAGAALAAFAVGAWLLWRARPPGLIQTAGVSFQSRQWAASVVPFGLIAAMQLGNKHADTLVLGYFGSAADVGIYRVAVQASTLVAFGFQAATMVMAPHIARLYAQGKTAQLQKLVTASSWVIFLSSLPVTCVFVWFGKDLLSLMFGPEYVAGHLALSILAVSRLLANAVGPVSTLLSMSGHERITAAAVSAGAACNLVLNFLLIPRFGVTGAAAASAISLVAWHVLMWRMATRKLGIRTLLGRVARND